MLRIETDEARKPSALPKREPPRPRRPPDEVKPDFDFHAVETIDEVIKLVFENAKKSISARSAKSTNLIKPTAEIASKH